MSVAADFKNFTDITYPEQGKAFLNAYFNDLKESDYEDVWNAVESFANLDLDNGKEGKDLDEFNSHRFLEQRGETKTIKEMREALTAADFDFNKRLAVIEYFLWKHNKTIEDFLSRPQGSNEEEIKACQEQLQKVQTLLQSAIEKAESAKKSEAQAKASEAAAKKAEAELKAALAELKSQEEAYNAKTEQLKKKSEEGGVVSRNRAKNELAQHLAEDPLPLSRAKITTEAATKKAEKARKEAEEKRQAAEDDRAAAEKAVEETQQQMAEAENALAEAKKKSSGGKGSFWWMERELAEARKYLPASKGGTWAKK